MPIFPTDRTHVGFQASSLPYLLKVASMGLPSHHFILNLHMIAAQLETEWGRGGKLSGVVDPRDPTLVIFFDRRDVRHVVEFRRRRRNMISWEKRKPGFFSASFRFSH